MPEEQIPDTAYWSPEDPRWGSLPTKRMSDDKKCPLCSGTCVTQRRFHSIVSSELRECSLCGLPHFTWRRVGELQRERDKTEAEVQRLWATVDEIRARYPEDIFRLDSKTPDSVTAKLIRRICDEILATEVEGK